MATENIFPPKGGAGTGDVVGPVSSTDNAVVRYDGVTGRAVQNSLVTINDAGNIAVPALATVDGRDVSVDGAALDSHIASTANPHSVTKAQVGLSDVENAAASTLYIPLTQKAAANGVATLDAGGQIPSAQLPPIAITDTFVVASQAAQTALTAEVGDVAVRTDLNKSYILRVAPASTFSNWQELLTPTDSVLSVNSLTGAVSLTTTNIPEGTSLYFTDERAQDAVASGLVDSSTINFTYDDAFNTITADVIPAGIDKNDLGGSALTIANGGTGQTTANAALNAFLPTQTSQSGKFLQTDGSNTSWVASSGGLAPVATTSTVALAVVNTMYSCTSTGGFTITLPPVPTLGGVIGVMDAGETCSATNFIRVTPAAGQSIDGYPINDSILFDYVRASGVFYAAPGATSWKVQYQVATLPLTPGSARTLLSSGNVSTSSTTEVDMTGVTLSITTNKAGRIGFALTTSLRNNVVANVTFLNIQVNSVKQFGAQGIYHNQAVAGYFFATNLSGVSDILPAGTYTVKATWYVSANTSSICADTNNSTLLSAWEI